MILVHLPKSPHTTPERPAAVTRYARTMSDDGLFADLRPSQPVARGEEPDRLAAWQVSSLRTALDEAGLRSMEERKRLVEELIGRPVVAIHDLSAAEARAVMEALAGRKKASTSSNGSWDERQGDTWIDRL